MNNYKIKQIEQKANEYGKRFMNIHEGYEAYAEQEDVVEAFLVGAKEEKQELMNKICGFIENTDMSKYLTAFGEFIKPEFIKDIKVILND